MAYGSETPANRSSTHYGSTASKPKPPKKPKGSSGSSGGTGAPKAPTYDWGDGHGKVHTIPRQTHQQNTQAAQYGINLDAPLASPIDTRTAYGMAEAAAGRVYDPQIQAAQGIQSSLEPWYQQYLANVTSAQNAANTYAAPALQQAQRFASQPATAAPGLDPNSAAGQQSQQAGQSGQGLAQLGYATLAAIPTALTSYLSGAQGVAARELPQAKAFYGQKVGDLKAQRGQATVDEFGKLRTGEQNYGLATQTLLGNQANNAADIAIRSGRDPSTGQPLPSDPEKPILSGAFTGKTASQVLAMTPDEQQTYIDNYNSAVHPPKAPAKDPNALTPAQTRAAAAKKKKHLGDVSAATGKLRNRVTDIIDYGQTDLGHMGDDLDKPRDANGNYPTRKVTQADIDRTKVGKYGKLAEIAIAVRDGKKLTQAQIDYLHGLDPNFRIPREWIGKKATGVSDRPSTGGTTSDPYGSGPGHA